MPGSDSAAEDPVRQDQLGPALAEGIRWTREQLTAEDKRWLRELPYVLQISGFTLVHAALERPHLWMYVFDRLAAAASFLHQATPVCFFGHTHLAVAFERDTAVRGGTYSKMKIERGKKYFISVGSVGQPRDHDPRAAYAIYDLERETVELRRLNYPRPDPDEGAGKPAPVPPSPPGRSVASKNPLPRKPSAADD
jgi:hypothetical protein